MFEQDLPLIVIAGAALIAMVLAVFVFAVTARRFVSNDHDPGSANPSVHHADPALDTRERQDRRSGIPVDFPLTVNGTVIPCDRRRGSQQTG